MPPSETVTTWELVHETLAQMARHSAQILPIMGLIWLVQLPSFLSEKMGLPTDAMQMLGLPQGAASTILAIPVMLASYLGTSWSAVGWHRLSLLGEQPAAALPRWHTEPVLAYLVVSIFLPVLTWGVPIVAVLLVAGGLRALGAPLWLSVLPAVPGTVVAVWLTLRLSPVQVSRAVRPPISLAEARQRTAPLARPLWGVALLGALLMATLVGLTVFVSTYLLTDQFGYYHSDTTMILDAIFFGAAFFLFFIVTISMFNTVYRHIFPMHDVSASVFD